MAVATLFARHAFTIAPFFSVALLGFVVDLLVSASRSNFTQPSTFAGAGGFRILVVLTSVALLDGTIFRTVVACPRDEITPTTYREECQKADGAGE